LFGWNEYEDIMKIGIMIRATLILWLLLAAPGIAHAVDAEATVDRNRIAMGESVALTVTISGGSGNVDTSAIRDFQVAGTGTSTNIQIVNGTVTKQIRYTYTLLPRRHGRLKIPPLSVTSDREKILTREIPIVVSRQGKEPPGEKDVFVKAGVNRQDPYEGQQILYTFRFFQAVRTANLRFKKPAFEGFTAKEMGEPRRFGTTIAGRRYDVTEVGFVLIPEKPGNVTVDPAVLYCDIIVQKRSGGGRTLLDSFFDDPFLGRTERRSRTLQTAPVDITVKPLPTYKGKEEFSGLVGQFTLEASLDKAQLKMDESATLSVIVKGTGNIIDAEMPALSVPDALKIYPDSPEEEIGTGPEGFTGKKVFRSALVAVRPGGVDIGPFHLSYFDVAAGDYRTLTVPVIPLSVLPGEKTDPVRVYRSEEESTLPKIVKKKVEFTGHDILPLKEAPDVIEDRSEMSAGRFIIFLLLPAVLYLLFRFILLSRWKRVDTRTALARRALDALRHAKRPEADNEMRLSRLHEALVAAVRAGGGGVAGESLTNMEIRNILDKANIDGRLPGRAADLLERIESARYSGAGQPLAQGDELTKETEVVVKQLCGQS